jgi:hypothetical protein
MKKVILLLILSTFSHFIYAQETTKTYDPKLVGCWKGSEIGQQMKGTSKYWVSCRFENGTSTLLFVAIDKNGEVTQETENGKWWVENGKYYELHNYDGVTDIYDYEVVDENTINFKAIELMGEKNNSYIFTDYKIEED